MKEHILTRQTTFILMDSLNHSCQKILDFSKIRSGVNANSLCRCPRFQIYSGLIYTSYFTRVESIAIKIDESATKAHE